MKTSLHIYIDNKGSVRVTRNKGEVKHNEVCAKLNLEIPDSMFEKPALEATIKLHPSTEPAPVVEINASAITEWLSK